MESTIPRILKTPILANTMTNASFTLEVELPDVKVKTFAFDA